jgi:hypothetical protein
MASFTAPAFSIDLLQVEPSSLLVITVLPILPF